MAAPEGLLEVVEAMTENPGCCLTCGSTPTNLDGTPKPAIHAAGIDVDWGNDVYLCVECVDVICDLWDRPSREKWDKLRKIAVKLHKELQATREELESASADRDVLLSAGKVLEKAARELQETEA